MTERTCAVEDCGRKHEARGWCNAHYKRWRKTGSVGPAEVAHQKPTRATTPITCSIADCTGKARGHGLCSKHYQRARNHGDATATRRRSGEHHHGWRGRSVTYVGAHARIRRSRGLATAHPCAHCPKSAEHWAYDHEDPNELTGIVGGREARYSADPAHYIPLCVTCHHRFDH
ncbi:hypothetical protein GCM10009579_51270 [Streptomyces javensis]|uniref:HNH endonuclease n=1 Tax=Streptomyces javensis TaxID=114698 RepID=A0ABP4HRV5_9ACTN